MLRLFPVGSPAPSLVAVTLDDQGRRCLEYAARHLCERPLLVVHIVHETAETAGSYLRANGGGCLLPLEEVARRLLADFVADCTRELPDLVERDLRRLVVSGLPDGRIVELARRCGASEIVMGASRPHPGWWLLRHSITRGVVRRAHCPVIVVDAAGRRAAVARRGDPSTPRAPARESALAS